MSDSAETLTPAPEPEPVLVAEPEPVADPEAAELAALEQHAIEVPEGDGIVKLVPLAAVTKERDRSKTLNGENKTLKEQLAEAQRAAEAAKPYVDAAKAILAQPQAQQAPPEPQGPSPEERAELEEVARDLDFYRTDGSLDLDRAGRHQARVRKEAERIAQAQMAPLQQRSEIEQARSVLNIAKQWQDPVTKETADPQILADLWNHVSKQPGGLQTLMNPEAAVFIWGDALNKTRWRKAQQGGGAQSQQPVKVAAPQDPPVFVEASGGNTTPVTLNAMERRVAKDMGMTEAEYLKAAAKAPRGM